MVTICGTYGGIYGNDESSKNGEVLIGVPKMVEVLVSSEDGGSSGRRFCNVVVVGVFCKVAVVGCFIFFVRHLCFLLFLLFRFLFLNICWSSGNEMKYLHHYVSFISL